MPGTTAIRPRLQERRIVFVVLVAVLLGGLLAFVIALRGLVRTSPIYDPPVLAGQLVTCTAGFYAHRGSTIVLTISDHCYDRANPPRDAAGRLSGAMAQMPVAPTARPGEPAPEATSSS